MNFSGSSFHSQKLLDYDLRNYKMQYIDMNHFSNWEKSRFSNQKNHTYDKVCIAIKICYKINL